MKLKFSFGPLVTYYLYDKQADEIDRQELGRRISTRIKSIEALEQSHMLPPGTSVGTKVARKLISIKKL